jgi:hypothetical protein
VTIAPNPALQWTGPGANRGEKFGPPSSFFIASGVARAFWVRPLSFVRSAALRAAERVTRTLVFRQRSALPNNELEQNRILPNKLGRPDSAQLVTR